MQGETERAEFLARVMVIMCVHGMQHAIANLRQLQSGARIPTSIVVISLIWDEQRFDKQRFVPLSLTDSPSPI